MDDAPCSHSQNTGLVQLIPEERRPRRQFALEQSVPEKREP